MGYGNLLVAEVLLWDLCSNVAPPFSIAMKISTLSYRGIMICLGSEYLVSGGYYCGTEYPLFLI
jgi:hypothetical protein